MEWLGFYLRIRGHSFFFLSGVRTFFRCETSHFKTGVSSGYGHTPSNSSIQEVRTERLLLGQGPGLHSEFQPVGVTQRDSA